MGEVGMAVTVQKVWHKRTKEVVQKDFKLWSNQFQNSSHQIQGLVEGFTYIDDIAKQAGIYPYYWSLFKRNPKHWLIAFFSPYTMVPLTYRLNEPEHEEKATQTMKSHKMATLGFFQYILILFLLIFFWFLAKLSEWCKVLDPDIIMVANSQILVCDANLQPPLDNT